MISDALEFEPGDVIEGRYRIEAELGRGGFSRVFKATQFGVERPVALKIMEVESQLARAENRDAMLTQLIGRFEREAKLISKLRSPNTIEAYDSGRTEDGLLYMALEYVDGVTLGKLTATNIRMAPERVVKILRQVLHSLKEAHHFGILHRDLKPANIMLFEHLDEQDLVKVLDFGIAKLLMAQDDQSLLEATQQGMIVGTPAYMAPELIQNDGVGPASDIYALGLVAYEMATGTKPKEGKSSIELLGWQLAGDSARIGPEWDLPPGLCYIVNRMTAKEMERRYQSAQEVLDDLARWDDEVFVAHLDTAPEGHEDTLDMPASIVDTLEGSVALGSEEGNDLDTLVAGGSDRGLAISPGIVALLFVLLIGSAGAGFVIWQQHLTQQKLMAATTPERSTTTAESPDTTPAVTATSHKPAARETKPSSDGAVATKATVEAASRAASRAGTVKFRAGLLAQALKQPAKRVSKRGKRGTRRASDTPKRAPETTTKDASPNVTAPKVEITDHKKTKERVIERVDEKIFDP